MIWVRGIDTYNQKVRAADIARIDQESGRWDSYRQVRIVIETRDGSRYRSAQIAPRDGPVLVEALEAALGRR